MTIMDEKHYGNIPHFDLNTKEKECQLTHSQKQEEIQITTS